MCYTEVAIYLNNLGRCYLFTLVLTSWEGGGGRGHMNTWYYICNLRPPQSQNASQLHVVMLACMLMLVQVLSVIVLLSCYYREYLT